MLNGKSKGPSLCRGFHCQLFSIINTVCDVCNHVCQGIHAGRVEAIRDMFVIQKQQEYVAKLQAEIDELQKMLESNENAEEIVSRHIKLLHRYNEAKDATQILIGRLAAIRGTTIRQIHQDMGLLDEDAN